MYKYWFLAYQDKLFISITFISKFSFFHLNRIIILCMIIMFIHQNIYQYLSYINNNFYIAVVTNTNISNYLFLYSKNTFLQNYVQSILHISISFIFRFFTNLHNQHLPIHILLFYLKQVEWKIEEKIWQQHDERCYRRIWILPFWNNIDYFFYLH